jgi:hypothetical protein
MGITIRGRGTPLKFLCEDHKIRAYLNGTLFATIGTGTAGEEVAVTLPGLDGTGLVSEATSASNSDKLDGYQATGFVLSGGLAVAATSASDSDKLDGSHGSVFSLIDGTRAFTGNASGTGAYFSGALSAAGGILVGTYVACAGGPSGLAAGYIAIKDSGNTVRYVPVWS